MLLMDLAVPRDIDPRIGELKDAYLYTVDDLERLVEDNRRGRREAADDAEAIIDLQVSRYVEAIAAGTRNAPLKRLRAHGESTRNEVLMKARQQLDAGQDPRAVLDFLAHTLTNKLLHAPTTALRDAAISGDADMARAIERMLPPPQDDDAADPAP
jgi:glutamyl-tRNA reductase